MFVKIREFFDFVKTRKIRLPILLVDLSAALLQLSVTVTVCCKVGFDLSLFSVSFFCLKLTNHGRYIL